MPKVSLHRQRVFKPSDGIEIRLLARPLIIKRSTIATLVVHLNHDDGLTCAFKFKGWIPCSRGVAVPELTWTCGVPMPDNGLTAPEGGTGILMSSGLPGTIDSGRLGILMRFATLL